MKKGFTLVELLIVMVILAIFAIIIIDASDKLYPPEPKGSQNIEQKQELNLP